jgi:hypothetical protein
MRRIGIIVMHGNAGMSSPGLDDSLSESLALENIEIERSGKYKNLRRPGGSLLGDFERK